MALANCWEIKKCGREAGGAKAAELGVCVAAREALGHSCWAIAGTLCGGVVQGTVALKERNCMACNVYSVYNRISGTESRAVERELPIEEEKYHRLMVARMKR